MPQPTRFNFGPQTAHRLYRMSGGGDSLYPPSGVTMPSDGDGGDAKLAVTRTGGIAARTTTAVPHTFPSAVCDLLDEVTGDYYDPNQELEIFNSTKIAIGDEQVIQLKKIGLRYFVDVDDC